MRINKFRKEETKTQGETEGVSLNRKKKQKTKIFLDKNNIKIFFFKICYFRKKKIIEKNITINEKKNEKVQ